MVQVSSQNIEGYFKFLLSYLACSQIWLNVPVDHGHLGYITQFTKKNIACTGYEACFVHTDTCDMNLVPVLS
jgi:hypothetical protein